MWRVSISLHKLTLITMFSQCFHYSNTRLGYFNTYRKFSIVVLVPEWLMFFFFFEWRRRKRVQAEAVDVKSLHDVAGRGVNHEGKLARRRRIYETYFTSGTTQLWLQPLVTDVYEFQAGVRGNTLKGSEKNINCDTLENHYERRLLKVKVKIGFPHGSFCNHCYCCGFPHGSVLERLVCGLNYVLVLEPLLFLWVTSCFSVGTTVVSVGSLMVHCWDHRYF